MPGMEAGGGVQPEPERRRPVRRPRGSERLETAQPLAVLGFDAATEKLYRQVLRHSGRHLGEMADLVGRTPQALEHDLTPLLAVGLVRLARGRVIAAMPQVVLNRLITEESRRLAAVDQQLEQLRLMVPQLQAEHFDSVGATGAPVLGEVVPDTAVRALRRVLVQQGSGTLRWLRPLPGPTGGPDDGAVENDAAEGERGRRRRDPDDVDDVLAEAIAAGRRSQAVYPARALQVTSDELRRRAAIGEEIRIIADVPVRLEILGSSGALVVASTEDGEPARMAVRAPQLLDLADLAFQGLWERALPIPGLEVTRDRRAQERVLLLEQLASGAKDEQIARVLGWGLRTVRRRVAELMAELAVETRFQAGMEAVRRGWL